MWIKVLFNKTFCRFVIWTLLLTCSYIKRNYGGNVWTVLTLHINRISDVCIIYNDSFKVSCATIMYLVRGERCSDTNKACRTNTVLLYLCFSATWDQSFHSLSKSLLFPFLPVNVEKTAVGRKLCRQY